MKNNAAQQLGRLGGKVSSEAKTAAVRENGKLGGRPRKFQVGDRVEGGKRGTEDHDTGTIAGYWDDEEISDVNRGRVEGAVLVHWDSLVSTWDEPKRLRRL